MQRSLLLVTFVAALCAVPGSACYRNTAPVLQVYRETNGADEGLMADAILRGLEVKHWTVVSHTPGVIRANQSVAGGHYAVVDIGYNESAYSITHVASSPSFRFDGHIVHKRYNGWIKNLDAAILRELTLGPR